MYVCIYIYIISCNKFYETPNGLKDIWKMSLMTDNCLLGVGIIL